MYVAQNNKKDEIKSFVITVVIHALLFLLIWFYKVWTQPDPPTPGMPGIEINFGFTDAGSGDNNTTEQVSEASAQSISQPVETAVTTSELPNEHVVQEQQNTTTVTQQTQTTTAQANTNNTSRNTMQSNAKGNGGDGQGGPGLDMNGWRWVAPPKPQDNSNETGKIIFKIKVNEDGEVIDVIKYESSVSDAVVKKYKEAVERLEFEKIAGNNSVADISTGYITFIIKKN
jgi:protein TonB